MNEGGAWDWSGDFSRNDKIMVMGGERWELDLQRGEKHMKCARNNSPEAAPRTKEALRDCSGRPREMEPGGGITSIWPLKSRERTAEEMHNLVSRRHEIAR
jgi:hypothetical protein